MQDNNDGRFGCNKEMNVKKEKDLFPSESLVYKRNVLIKRNDTICHLSTMIMLFKFEVKFILLEVH